MYCCTGLNQKHIDNGRLYSQAELVPRMADDVSTRQSQGLSWFVHYPDQPYIIEADDQLTATACQFEKSSPISVNCSSGTSGR